MASRNSARMGQKKLKDEQGFYAPIDTVLVGDSWSVTRQLPADYVQSIVTSPPYFGHREYSKDENVAGVEFGREEEPATYVRKLVYLPSSPR